MYVVSKCFIVRDIHLYLEDDFECHHQHLQKIMNVRIYAKKWFYSLSKLLQ